MRQKGAGRGVIKGKTEKYVQIGLWRARKVRLRGLGFIN